MKEFPFSKICRSKAYIFTKNELLQSCFSRIFLLYYFSLWTHLTLLLNTNKKRIINWKNNELVENFLFLYFKFQFSDVPYFFFFHKFVTLSFLESGLLILGFKMWHIRLCNLKTILLTNTSGCMHWMSSAKE